MVSRLRLPAVGLVMAAALTTSSCGSPAASTPSTPVPSSAVAPSAVAPSAAAPSAAPSAAGEIVIGGVGPLSQPGDILCGNSMKWGIEQAVADLNAKGGILGRKVRLVFYDTQNKPDVAAAQAKRAVEEDKVVAIVGECHSGAALAQIPTYNAAGLPVVFSETFNDTITAGDPADPNLPATPPSIFRIAPTASYYNGFIVDWLTNGMKIKSLLHFTENTDYGIGVAQAMRDQLKDTGVSLKQVTINLAQPDYTSIIERAKEDNPGVDAVYFDISTPATTYPVMQSAISSGLLDEAICLGDSSMRDSAPYWRGVPEGRGCAFQFVGLTKPQFNDIAKSLNDRYNAAFGGDARNDTFEGYDSTLIVADAIERAGSTDAKAVVAALEKTSMVGAMGEHSFPYNSASPVPADKPGWLWHTWPEPPLTMLEYTENDQALDNTTVIWPQSKQTTPGSAYVPVTR